MKRSYRIRYDVLLLLCAVIGVLLVLLRYRLMSEPYGETENAEVSFRVTGLSEVSSGTLLSADSLTLTGAQPLTYPLKTVPVRRPALMEYTRNDGTLTVKESSTAFDVHAVFLCEGHTATGGFFAGGRHMAAGERYSAQICGLTVTIEILNIDLFSSN